MSTEVTKHDPKRKRKEVFKLKGIEFVVYYVEGSDTVVVKPRYPYMYLGDGLDIELEREIVGKSTCSKDDTFDYHKGVLIASYRALCEIRTVINQRFKKIEKEVNSFNDFVAKRKPSNT